jgi:CubicO group peptidase (beta-lactamase class C family)
VDLCAIDSYRPGDNGTLFSPQGGLRISVLGLARIGRMLLGEGAVGGVRLLRPDSVATLFTPVWRWGEGEAGDTYKGLMRAYGPGAQCLSGEPRAPDQPLAGRSLAWCGHLGEAYGLLSGLWIDRAAGRAYVYALTGSRDDPARYPHRSAFTGPEEAILTALADH